jgi:hypothetical protein
MINSIKFSFIILSLLFLSVQSLQAQENVKDKNVGNWNTLNLQYTFAPKWGVMLELQTRLNKPFYELNYYEQKGGIYYNINKNFQVLLGTGHYGTHDIDNFSDGPIIREARIWQQFIIKQYLSRLKFEHRFRN